VYDEQVFAHVARILTAMSDPPNPRTMPNRGDLQGNFDLWFDGGAVKHDTGISRYAFTDGASAVTGSSLRLAVEIELPGGRRIDVTEAL
jgi:hypothetical protein